MTNKLKITKNQLKEITEHLGGGNTEHWFEDVDLNGRPFRISTQPAELRLDDEGFNFCKLVFHPNFAGRYGVDCKPTKGDAFIFAEEGGTYEYSNPAYTGKDEEEPYLEFRPEIDDYYLNDVRFGGNDIKAENYRKYYLDAYIHGAVYLSIAGEGTRCRFDTSRGVGVAYLDKQKFLEMGFTEEQWKDDEYCAQHIRNFLSYFNANYNGYTEIMLEVEGHWEAYGDWETDYQEMKEILENEIFEAVEPEPFIELLRKRKIGDEAKYTNLKCLRKYILDTTEVDVKLELERMQSIFSLNKSVIEFKDLMTFKNHYHGKDIDFTSIKELHYIAEALKINNIKFLKIDDTDF